MVRAEIPEISRSISRTRVLLRLEPVSVASKPLSGKPSLLPLLLCSCPPAVNRPKPSFSPARLSPPDDSDSSGQPEKLASFGMTYVPLLNVAQIFLGFRFKENGWREIRLRSCSSSSLGGGRYLVKTSATLREAGGRRGIVNTIVRSPIELCSPPSPSKTQRRNRGKVK